MKMVTVNFKIAVTFIMSNDVGDDSAVDLVGFTASIAPKNKKIRIYDAENLEYDIVGSTGCSLELSDGSQRSIVG